MDFDAELGWRLLTAQEREREYSPSSCVGGNIEPYLRDYREGSAAAYAWCAANSIDVHTYAYGPEATQTFDIVAPGSADAPLVVFIHGGYWQQLSKQDSFAAARDFVANGIAYAAIDYTLAPDATLDQIVEECRAALAVVSEIAPQLAIDPERIVIAGSSAGAHLSAMTSLDPTTDWRPAGMILLSGVFQLEPLIGTSINDAVGLDVASALRNSPAGLPLLSVPAALVAWGENETDQFKQQSQLFSQLLATVGPPPAQLEVAKRNHFDILSDLGNNSQLGDHIRRLIESTSSGNAL